jgi:hypothetical protein
MGQGYLPLYLFSKIIFMKAKISQTTPVEGIPYMPMPYNLHYSMKWWTSMSVGGVECKGGSFNLELYLAIVHRELYNCAEEEVQIPEKKSPKSISNYLKSLLSKLGTHGDETI